MLPLMNSFIDHNLHSSRKANHLNHPGLSELKMASPSMCRSHTSRIISLIVILNFAVRTHPSGPWLPRSTMALGHRLLFASILLTSNKLLGCNCFHMFNNLYLT